MLFTLFHYNNQLSFHMQFKTLKCCTSMALNNTIFTVHLKEKKIQQKQVLYFTFLFYFRSLLKKLFFQSSVQTKKVYTLPIYFLLRPHQHDTHEAWGQQFCKDHSQVDLVKTGFLF